MDTAQAIDLHALVERVDALERENRILRDENERLEPGQLSFVEESEAARSAAEAERSATRKARKSAAGHGRAPFGDHLPRVDFELDLPLEERTCSSCTAALKPIGEEVTERGHLIPAQLVVHRFRRPKYACPHGHEIKTASLPDGVVEKAKYDASVHAHVAVAKYTDHLPLNRMEGIFKRYGVKIPKQTLWDMLLRVDELVSQPILTAMKQELLREGALHADETSVTVTPEGQKGSRTGWIWDWRSVRGEGPEKVLVEFRTSRSRAGPIDFLGDWTGTLVTDGFAGYDAACRENGIVRAGCWAHARRKVKEAWDAGAEEARGLLASIGRLFTVERAITARVKRLRLDAEGRLALRQRVRTRTSRRLIAKIHEQAEELAQRRSTLPKSRLGKAVGYLANQRGPLSTFLDDARIPIHNNDAERDLRHVVTGRVWSIDALWDLYAMSMYGNITSISESPVLEGLVYVGTDDGLIQVTEDGGANWRRIDSFEGLPHMAFVNDVKADLFDADVVYATFDDHKTGDFAPYVLKSTDKGRTWSSIAGDLPERHLVWRIEQDHVVPELLFAGTEFGLFVTLDGGGRWLPMKGGAPTIPWRDIAVQRRENDLVGATFGRGFWVLDDYSPLRELSEERLESEEFHLFDVRPALSYIEDDRLGGLKGSQGDAYYTADNPAYGAVFTYYLRDSLQTQEQERAKREKDLKEEGADSPYPGWDALQEEEREEDPALFFEVRDAAGALVARVEGAKKGGIHRTSWDLRYAAFTAGGGSRWRRARGPLALPGTYSVQAFQRHESTTRALGAAKAFEVVSVMDPALERQDRAETLAFQMRVGELQRAISGTVSAVDAALEEARAARDVVASGNKLPLELLDRARSVEQALLDACEALVGDSTASSRRGPSTPSIRGRVQTALYGTLGQTYGPTTTHRRQAEIARTEYDQVVARIRQAVEVDLAGLKATLDEAGAPWTPGRRIPDLQDD